MKDARLAPPASGEPVAIVGAGSWGTALGIHLARLGRRARLWARDPVLAGEMEGLRENRRYLAGLRLPDGLQPTADGARALVGAAVVIVAVPSEFVREVMSRLAPQVPREAVVVSATKGLDRARGRRMSEVLEEVLPGRPLAVLSGPSFAREVALGRPTALVVASASEAVAQAAQRALAASAFRLYTNRDVVGVEMAGALKNVIAIAAGLCDGLDLGENARAALITRGLAEMVRLGVAFGATPSTFAGLAGVGDLVLTATGSLSRNRTLGLAIGRGRRLEEVEAATPTVAEGVRTVGSALDLAGRERVSMPICDAVGAVLLRGEPAAGALARLLARELRAEEDDHVELFARGVRDGGGARA